MSKYTIDVRFTTSVKRTERVLEVAEAFGLGLDDKEFVVVDNQTIDVCDGDIVYITGQSGSGKSTILNRLYEAMRKSGKRVMRFEDVVEDPDQPIVDQCGKDTNEALALFSIAGLSDANLYLRRPGELSDGQRYRFRLAKIIESGAEVWYADEVMAILDRVTAKCLAFNMQKIARRRGATLVVATTHTDMLKDLNPNLYIEKMYREKISINYAPEGYNNEPQGWIQLDGSNAKDSV